MIRFLIRFLLNAGALLLIAYYINGIELSGWYASSITVVILGLVNTFIRPLLLLIALPLRLMTLGLFTLVINAAVFWFVSTVVEGFLVVDFGSAFLGALGMTLFGAVINRLFKKKK